MPKKKTKQTNTVAFATPPETADVTSLRNQASQGADYATPIRNSYARAEQSLNRSYDNPLGAYTTADVRDKSKRSQHQDLHQNMGIDLANAAQANAEGSFNRQATVAGFTRPQMYGSGGTQTVSDPMGSIMQIGQMASGVGQAALM
jgi:hypothetical protein